MKSQTGPTGIIWKSDRALALDLLHGLGHIGPIIVLTLETWGWGASQLSGNYHHWSLCKHFQEASAWNSVANRKVLLGEVLYHLAGVESFRMEYALE